MRNQTPTEITMAKVRAEWEAPLLTRIHELESRLDALTADRDQWKGRADQLQEERDDAQSRLDSQSTLLADTQSLCGKFKEAYEVCEERFQAAREAWDVLFAPPPAQPDHVRVAAHQKLIDALSGLRTLPVTEADIEWARNAIQESAVERLEK